MRTKAIHTLIDDAANKSRNLAAKAVEKTNEALGTARNSSEGAAATIVGTFKKGGHRFQETAEKAAHEAEEIAVKAAHAAEEVAQTLSNGLKEMTTKAQHRGRELAEKAARKLKPR
jgi:ABC-type transporter Mla subunit MlaD